MISKNDKILVIDSGLGGLSVLKELLKKLPNENYIYFGDSKNVPYGEKTKEEMLSLVIPNIKNYLEHKSIKALVIACNTMSVTISNELRKEFPELIIAETKPNIKDPVNDYPNSKLLVLSTPVTSKSSYLLNEIRNYQNSEIIPIGLPGLIDYVENINFNQNELNEYFIKHLKPYMTGDIKAISLGCTHYPFLKDYIEKFMMENGFNVTFYDGSSLTINELYKSLKEKDLLNNSGNTLEIYNSLNDEMVRKSYILIER